MNADDAISFSADVKPLFRQGDRESMEFAFDLWAYEDVKEYSATILERLRDGSMPCDRAWPQEQIDLFERWIDGGMPE